MKQYDYTISAVKAIGIMLVVIGHAYPPVFINTNIYLIHMPLFVFASGIFMKQSHIDNPKKFVLQRTKGVYWPYVKFGIVFILLHNIFVDFHIHEDYYNISDMTSKILDTFKMRQLDSLTVGFWFLRELFISSLMIYVLIFILDKLRLNSLVVNVFFVVLLLFLTYITSTTYKGITLPLVWHTTFTYAAYFLSGYIFGKTKLYNNYNLIIGILGLLLMVVMSFFFKGGIFIEGSDVFMYFMVSLVGVIGAINCIGMLPDIVKRKLDYIGTKTLYILTFHILCFKPISYVIIKINNLDYSFLQQRTIEGGMWILYSISGIILPLLIWEIIQFIKRIGLNLYKYVSNK